MHEKAKNAILDYGVIQPVKWLVYLSLRKCIIILEKSLQGFNEFIKIRRAFSPLFS